MDIVTTPRQISFLYRGPEFSRKFEFCCHAVVRLSGCSMYMRPSFVEFGDDYPARPPRKSEDGAKKVVPVQGVE